LEPPVPGAGLADGTLQIDRAIVENGVSDKPLLQGVSNFKPV
jgi:hypothetical protein